MTEDDLEMVLRWRNHPDVRRHMYSPGEIGREEHVRWFERNSRDPRHSLLIHEREGQPTAYVSFISDERSRRASWGFYAAPGAPRGSGRAMARDALGFAFRTLGLHKVCGEAIAANVASIGFHQALGFTREGVLREQHFDGSRYHDVFCFGLLEQDWREQEGLSA
jgi:UDP-4-amino-4,6-dideoxy-N-acetyl-beta-L-altrosamine N-acetyltransferase